MSRLLHLHLKREYFDQIKSGEKKEEFRRANDFWEKRLRNPSFDGIVLYRAYPKAGDPEKILHRPWRGFTEKIITHPHFENVPTRVYAIIVN